MGALTSRQNAAVEEADVISTHAYKYPPKSGNYFGSHFIMGGERFDTPQPEAYLFGENADLNFLGSRPTAFPYPPPQANEPTKTLKSLVNIRKESVRFVKAPDSATKAHGDGGVNKGNALNIEFIFDSDAKCAITIYYFCTEEVSPSGVTFLPRESLTSETFHYKKGVNQYFSQPSHIFNPHLFPEDDLTYNATKEKYPVAIHCVAEEGNEDCRQSHTTICVIDHHSDNSYALRALKQKIFVDGLCYLLQEIYGIENKALNKPTMDDDTDDNGSECVICMSDTRDTLILPCRHLCLCNSCADSLRYQANNCPICRSPFRALLQIRAVQKGVSSNLLAPQNSPDPNCEHIPSGYIPVSLIEALNGPPQCIGRTMSTDSNDVPDAVQAAENLNRLAEKIGGKHSPKSGSQRRSKNKKNSECAPEFRMSVLNNSEPNPTPTTNETTETVEKKSPPSSHRNSISYERSNSLKGKEKTPASRQISRDSLHIVNERHSLKKKDKTLDAVAASAAIAAVAGDNNDDDSDNEKLSPLLSPGSRNPLSGKSPLHIDGVEESIDDIDMDELKSDGGSKRKNRPALSADGDGNILAGAEDSDYYTPEDPHTTILSPLCPEKPFKNGEKLSQKDTSLSGTSIGLKNNIAKKSLHQKSTSVGNISSTPITALKENVSSLPDMLDGPIGVNSTSTRSSSDSYSSSSSTKQLLSSNQPSSSATKIMVDDKAAVQNAVNV
ncbi:probable E3 ubiquitin-protein ligase MGRN1 isoform X1 [Episyrphus balteatus]|uniref:probable E3 ubiquitin-protein ligase MGRN1 isoform X1 n=1 Tax=Episyrphus balteatus TaxID=286459 RepID=UPI0024856922|nr:probable E3 ubiquitin-protein ligase MGRN1 isoform X1 [Episyrphus balteatus]